MLTMTNLSCNYGVVRALRSVSIDIQKPGIYSVIGANGAGKSTLINAICGRVPISEGNVVFNGVNTTHMDSYQIAGLGMSVCPEGRHVFATVSVYENLLAGAYVLKDKKRIAENVETVYQLFPRLAERRKQLAGTLSGGEQQMLAVGRALMADPKFILMDEPSMGLAPNLVDFVFETIVRIYHELSIPSLIVEQNSEMALSISDYAYLLEVGNLVLEGTGKELLGNDEVRQKYLGA